MIAETTEILWSNVGAEEFLAMVGLIVLQHEIGMENARATFLIMKSFSVAI